MIGLLPGMRFFLLQPYFKDDNPVEAMIFVIGVGAVIFISVVIQIIRAISKARNADKVAPINYSRRFSIFAMRRIAKAYGLNRRQKKLLDYMFRAESIKEPERIMTDSGALDRLFQRSFRNIERNSRTEEEIQQRLVGLFSLRNIIEAAPGLAGTPVERFAKKTPAVLAIENNSYPVTVITSERQNVITTIPKSALGSMVRLPKGAKVNLSFFTNFNKGYSMEGRIIDIVDADKEQGVQIGLTGKTKALASRKYKRRQINIPCEFHPVRVVETGKKTPPKLVVDKKGFKGTLMDISIGGCSLKASAPILVGSHVKINIDYSNNYLISVLGQLLRTNRSVAVGTIMHFKFLKVPRRAFNSISALVFGYDD